MSYCRTHPDHDSIFGDTYAGVPNPRVPHEHPYPTRYHGPNLNVPRFGLPYREKPYAVPPFSGMGRTALGQSDCPLLLRSITGYAAMDGVIGAAVGYALAPSKSDAVGWAAIGGVATAMLGTIGLAGAAAGAFYAKTK